MAFPSLGSFCVIANILRPAGASVKAIPRRRPYCAPVRELTGQRRCVCMVSNGARRVRRERRACKRFDPAAPRRSARNGKAAQDEGETPPCLSK